MASYSVHSSVEFQQVRVPTGCCAILMAPSSAPSRSSAMSSSAEIGSWMPITAFASRHRIHRRSTIRFHLSIPTFISMTTTSSESGTTPPNLRCMRLIGMFATTDSATVIRGFPFDGVAGGYWYYYGNTGVFDSRQGRFHRDHHTMGRVLKLSYET